MALTLQQSLELKSINRKNRTQSPRKKLFNYIYFSDPFTLQIKDVSRTVTKTISRPLAVKGIHYESFVNLDLAKESNITVFKKYVLAKCNGSVLLYTTEDYMKMANWSIYVKKTSSLYDYGEYDILPNKSVTICQYFEMRIPNKTRQTVGYNKVPGLGYLTFISFLLSILCLIFLLVTYLQLQTLPSTLLSILCLIFLLVTYPQLQTLLERTS